MQVLSQLSYSPTERGFNQRVRSWPPDPPGRPLIRLAEPIGAWTSTSNVSTVHALPIVVGNSILTRICHVPIPGGARSIELAGAWCTAGSGTPVSLVPTGRTSADTALMQ